MRTLLSLFFAVMASLLYAQNEGYDVTYYVSQGEWMDRSAPVKLEIDGEVTDSALVLDGVVRFTGKIEFPRKASLWIKTKDYGWGFVYFVIENSRIRIAHDSIDKKHEHLTELNGKFRQYNKTLTSAMVGNISTEDFMDKAQETLDANRENALGGIVLQDMAQFLCAEKFDSLYQTIPANYRSKQLDAIKQKNDQVLKTSKGQPATFFEMNDADGNIVKLSDVVGRNKYTLLDFWASWCGPCIAEIPNLKAAYNRFHDKGFEVVGVSLDKDRDAWLKAIKDNAMPWIQLCDMQETDGPAAKLYAVRAIPATILISQDGKIVARDLRGKELEKMLEQLLEQLLQE